jgi:hypothetical protein
MVLTDINTNLGHHGDGTRVTAVYLHAGASYTPL